MLVTPFVDYAIIEGLDENWTVTKTLYFFLVMAMPLFAIVVNAMRSKTEKRLMRAMFLVFGYTIWLTYTSAQELSYPVFGFVSLLGAVFVAMIFYCCLRDGNLAPTKVFYVLALSSCLVAIPMLQVTANVAKFTALRDAFGTSYILYGYENPRAVGWIATFSLILTSVLLLERRGEERFILLLSFVATIAAATLFWSGSRGGILAFLMSLGVFLVMSRNATRWRLAHVIACVFSGLILSLFMHLPSRSFGFFARVSSSLDAEGVDGLSSSRMTLWKNNLSYIFDQPLTGYGLLPHKYLPGLSGGSAHNIIIELWLWFGILLGSAVLLALIWLWIALLRIALATSNPHIRALFALTTTFAVYCLYSGPYARTLPLLFVGISVGTILGYGARKPTEAIEDAKSAIPSTQSS
ncbi:O-antigen ligase family protein [Yoonia litorea]|nr:O-antigen ligase family protein [Yoonia litorea]